MEDHVSWWKMEMKHFSLFGQSIVSQMKSNNSVLGWLTRLGCKWKASNFHGKVFSFLLIVYFGTSLLLFCICVLQFTSWVKANGRRAPFRAAQHMHIFLGSCISPTGSEQNGPGLFSFRRDRDLTESHSCWTQAACCRQRSQLSGGATVLWELLHLSPISVSIKSTKSVQQPCYYCQFCSLPHHFWTTERLKYYPGHWWIWGWIPLIHSWLSSYLHP